MAWITAQLRNLTKNNVYFKWQRECGKLFQHLKQCLTSEPVLVLGLYKPAYHLELSSDANQDGLGYDVQH